MKQRKDDNGRVRTEMSRAARAVLKDTYYEITYLFPNAVIVESEKEGPKQDVGVLRFRENTLIRHLVNSGKVNLNDLAVDYQNGKFSIDDAMEFWQGLGYSLSGFLDIFGDVVAERYEKAKQEGLVR